MSDHFDESYWGSGGIDVSKWGTECRRGLQYKNHGISRDGAKNQVRKFSGGRKFRGDAFADWERATAAKDNVPVERKSEL